MWKFIKLIALVGVALFCWGWVSNVFLGRMTTRQYIDMINRRFDHWVISKSEKALSTPYVSGVISNYKTFYAKGGD